MKGYGIYVKNDLLDKKHLKAFGTSSLWLYLWLLDKMTSIGEDGIGKVLGGRPIKYSEVEAELGISERSYKRYIKILRDDGYIVTLRTMRGLIISVNKASKIFKNSDRPKVAHQDRPKVVERSAKVAHLIGQSGTSNKTIQYDNTKTIQTTTTARARELDIYDCFVKSFGFAPTKAKQTNLNSINRIIVKNNIPADELAKIIKYASTIQGEKYAPAINNFWDIEDKYPDILRFYANKKKRSIRNV